MGKMKTVRAYIQSVWLDCPNGCEDSIKDKFNGNSLLWQMEGLPFTVTCSKCGEKLRVPNWVHARQRHIPWAGHY